MAKTMREELKHEAIDAVRQLLIEVLKEKDYCEAKQIGSALETLLLRRPMMQAEKKEVNKPCDEGSRGRPSF